MSTQALWWVGSDMVRFALLDRHVISPTFKFKLPAHKAKLVEAAKHSAVRQVVQHALDVESSLKKRTTTRVRVKLSDGHAIVLAFKAYVRDVARALKLL